MMTINHTRRYDKIGTACGIYFEKLTAYYPNAATLRIVIVWPIGYDNHPDILWIDTPVKSEIIKTWKQAILRVKSVGFRYRTKDGAA